MKATFVTFVLLGLAVQAFGQEFDNSDLATDQGQGRVFFNTTGAAGTLSLLGAAILAILIAYLIFAGGNGLFGSNYKRNDYGYGQYDNQYDNQYAQYRSSQDGYDFNSANVIQWISMLQDLYEKFDYNDVDCQKRLICEVMKEPDYYGAVAKKFKNGFQYAKYLELLSLPDEMRELLDEYLDANNRAEQQKDCSEYFQCDYSIKDSMRRSETGNHL